MPRIIINGLPAFIDCGGPTFKISVKHRIIEFEWHPYCGPIALKKNGDPASKQPKAFLEAASLWAQQGKRMENGLCRWDHEPEPIIKKIGRHRFFAGEHPPKRGE